MRVVTMTSEAAHESGSLAFAGLCLMAMRQAGMLEVVVRRDNGRSDTLTPEAFAGILGGTILAEETGIPAPLAGMIVAGEMPAIVAIVDAIETE